ncbi:GIY-YIG nuclease family protein [Spongiimicrobium sp. 3-5]|uniref:GIY-YIG nuclease family protein n=1 Tax=Spongiimicrobium sp. 3-5 TaxID=3332596 RepID=UPI00397F2F6A
MQEFVVYIMYSERYNKRYTGFTSNLIDRFRSHNKLAHKGFSVKYRPWKVVHVEFFDSKKEAMAREKFLKSGVGRAWVREALSL